MTLPDSLSTGAASFKRLLGGVAHERLDPLERRIRVDLFVFNEFNWRQTIGIQNASELLDSRGLPVNSARLSVPPDEDVHESSRALGLLPYLVAQCARLVLANVGHKL